MVFKKIYITISLAVAFTLALHGQHKEKLLKEINKIIYYDSEINYKQVPGFIIGIINGDSTYILNFGTKSKNGQGAISSNDHFEIGGITKTFTAALVKILIKEGKMKGDDSLNSYLLPNERNTKMDISIDEILHHTAGLPRLPHGIGIKEKEANNPYGHYTKDDLFSFYINYRLFEEEKSYQYSHVSFALLETAIENVCNEKYETVLKKKLLEPLGMNSTFINSNSNLQISEGYNIIGKRSKPWSYSSFEASVGLKSNLNDLLTYSKLQLGMISSEFAEEIKEMHRPTEVTAMDKNTFMASSWHVIKKRYCNVIAHSGSTAGHRAFVGFVKESQTAVVVLSNSESSMNSLGFYILKMLNNNWKKIKSKSS